MATEPKTVYTLEGVAEFKVPKGTTIADATKLVSLPGSTPENAAVVVWNGHIFEVLSGVRVDLDAENDDHDVMVVFWRDHPPVEYIMTLHYPVAGHTNEGDWKNAIKAEANAEGAWEPVWDDGDHHDHEELLSAAARNRFSGLVEEATVKLAEATNAPARREAKAPLSALQDFRDEVEATVVAEARTRHLGYYLQNPHEAHVRDPLRRAINAVATTWQGGSAVQQKQYRAISSKVAEVLKDLGDHSYETRWDRAKRLAAEEAAKKKAAESAGE